MATCMQNKLNYARVIAFWGVFCLCGGGCDSFSKEKWIAYNANSGGALLKQWLNPVFRYEPNAVRGIDIEAISMECADVVKMELNKIAKGDSYYPRPLLVKIQRIMASGFERTRHSNMPHDLLLSTGCLYSMASTYLGRESDILADRLYAVCKNDDDTVDVAVQYVALFDNSLRRPRTHFSESEFNYHGIGVGCVKHDRVFIFLAGEGRFTLDTFLPELKKSNGKAALYWGHGNSGLGVGRHRYKADEFEKWIIGQEHIYPMKLILVSKCMYFFSCLTPCAKHTQ